MVGRELSFWAELEDISIAEAALLMAGITPCLSHVNTLIDGQPGLPGNTYAFLKFLQAGIFNEGIELSRGIFNNYPDEERRPEHVNPSSKVFVLSLQDFLQEWQFECCLTLDDNHTKSVMEDNTLPPYLNREHPRYSPKLAAAVRCWESIENAPTVGMTVRQCAENWLKDNSDKFDLGDSENPKTSVIQVISTVVNWYTKGGAPRKDKSAK